MKLKYLLSAAALSFTMAGGYAINNSWAAANTTKPYYTMATENFDYDKAWAEVEELAGKRLPKQALSKVLEIRASAKSENNYFQIIKSYIFGIDFAKETGATDEESTKGLMDELRAFEQDAAGMPCDYKAISMNRLAHYYDAFYNSRKSSIRRRTELESDNSDDIETWGPARFNNEILSRFRKSIENAGELASQSAAAYEDLAQWNTIITDMPATLFDHLGLDLLRYLDKSVNQDSDLSFKSLEFLAPASEFVKFCPSNHDTASCDNLRLSVFQALVSAHLGDSNKAMLLEMDSKRLSYYRHMVVNERAESQYMATLQKMRETYSENKLGGKVCFLIAESLERQGKMKEAHDFAEQMSKQYNDKNLPILMRNIERKQLSFDCEDYVSPGADFPICLKYTNLDKACIRIVELKDEKQISRNRWNLIDVMLSSKTVWQQEYRLVNTGDYHDKSSELIISGLKPGIYGLMACSDSLFKISKSASSDVIAFQDFRVCQFAVVKDGSSDSAARFRTLDRATGKALPGVCLTIISEKKKVFEGVSGPDGSIEVPEKITSSNSAWNTSLEFSLGNSKASFDGYFLSHGGYFHEDDSTVSTKIFTDRRIYRPGQTIYWKALIYGQYGDKANVCRNAKTAIRLTDPNGKIVADKEIITNDFGSAHGEFVIPEDLLNGEFSITDIKSGGSCYVRVEEYKRPTFQVEFSNPEGEAKVNESITVKGSAATYAGIKVSGAKVKYTIMREPQWRGWNYYSGASEPSALADGETTTGPDGEFQITFSALPNPNDEPSEHLTYNYRVIANVTDINGETRSAACAVSAGYRSLFLSVGLGSGLQIMENTDLSKVSVSAATINGHKVAANVKVTASRLQSPGKPRIKKRWASCANPIYTRQEWDEKFPYLEYQSGDTELDSLKVSEQIMATEINTGQISSIDLSAIKQMGTGCYLIRLESADKDGKPVNFERRIMLFSNAQGNIADISQCIVLSSDKQSYEPGDVATIYLSSAFNDVAARYIISDGKHVIESKEIAINASTAAIKVPIKESQRGGITFQAYFLKYNRIFSQRIHLDVPYTNKKLKVDFETFRDCLYPGEGEKWKIRITDYAGRPADAEMVATLYDESLDALYHHSWSFYLYGQKYTSDVFDFKLFGSSRSSQKIGDQNQPLSYITPQISTSLQWFGHTPRFFQRFNNDLMDALPGKRFMGMAKSKVCESAPMAANEEMEVMRLDADDAQGSNAAPAETEDFGSATIRTNFSELAFFKPDAVTDKDGELYIEFTVPESITQWKMMGLAHTKDLSLGQAQQHLVTKKDFSIQPNLPRFLRCGDEISIPVKISNLTDSSSLKGQVKMEILSADGQKPLQDYKIDSPLQDFEAAPGQTIAKTFTIKVPQMAEPIIVKVTGVSGTKSDGEQHMLPVLTDKQLVTEAITLSVRANQTRKYEFSALKNKKSESMASHSFTLEYSSNPAWYAVTSLPWLTSSNFDCYDCTISKLFANTVSGLIIKHNPQISKMLSTWQKDKSQVLTSPLLKNQELKSALIDETPWAIDAKDENERMSQLSSLLDSWRIESENGKLIKKLEEGQLSNGAWPWFDGMRPSRGTTQYIALSLGKMRHMGASLDSRIDKMLRKAMKFLDSEIVEYHKECIKLGIEPGFYGYQYMYMRTFFPEYKISGRTQEAYDFVMDHAKKNWTRLHLHNQALLCATFKRAGQEQIARDIIASFSDRAIHSDEFGMYYNENVNGVLMHEQNIETQAQVIEAFQEFKMADEVEELKIWLIKNRQANNWKTYKATTEAVYAMFLCGNEIKCDEPLCKITLGGNTVDMSGAESGTGYFKQQWQASDMDLSMADITVENPNSHISYGAAYFQYFENIDKIQKADNKLKIDKQMFLTTLGAKGTPVLSEIKDGTPVRPGDKVIVRFVIKTDRDLEYVHLKDMRAAGFEPLNVLSQTKYQDGMMYYESTKDASENFFIEHLNKGTYVFEYPLIAVHAGNFSNGIASIQCMYAPEFVANSEGRRIKIDD